PQPATPPPPSPAAAAEAAPEGAAPAQQAALPPLRKVSVPQLPPSSYTRRDYTQIQVLLEDAGFDPGPIDGHWGPRTRRALAAFQREHGLRASGEPDAATLDALGFY
ncbi:MAG TPA: peptidoglycan-binding domain-containing protein, partial [Kiloniellaceae bacterium]|nr:peptidoglycan-binding domain-containing protein [Kiloniellaceae bacterium]